MTWSPLPRGDIVTLLEKLVEFNAKLAELTVKKQLAQARLDAARNLALEKLGITGAATSLQPANLGGTSSQPLYGNQGAGDLGAIVNLIGLLM